LVFLYLIIRGRAIAAMLAIEGDCLVGQSWMAHLIITQNHLDHSLL
jgi:hypothetical protein